MKSGSNHHLPLDQQGKAELVSKVVRKQKSKKQQVASVIGLQLYMFAKIKGPTSTKFMLEKSSCKKLKLHREKFSKNQSHKGRGWVFVEHITYIKYNTF